MRRATSAQRGLTLLETLAALLLMTMTAWGLQVLYASLMKGTRMSDSRRGAITQADALLKEWQHKALETWPTDGTPALVEGEVDQYLYRVTFSGLIPNPYYTGPQPPVAGDPNGYLQMQTVTLELYYKEKTQDSDSSHRVKWVGSASR